jgi:hypothetical protein
MASEDFLDGTIEYRTKSSHTNQYESLTYRLFGRHPARSVERSLEETAG